MAKISRHNRQRLSQHTLEEPIFRQRAHNGLRALSLQRKRSQTGQARRITSESSHGSYQFNESLGTEGKEDQRVDMCDHYQGCGGFRAQ